MLFFRGCALSSARSYTPAAASLGAHPRPAGRWMVLSATKGPSASVRLRSGLLIFSAAIRFSYSLIRRNRLQKVTNYLVASRSRLGCTLHLTQFMLVAYLR